MSLDYFHRIRRALELDLPGEESQIRMTSLQRRERMKLKRDADARKSAVLLLLYPVEADLHLVLTKRPDYPGVHGGQISFPGGKLEPDDPDLMFTALRETEEEIGIQKQEIDVLGSLSELYIPPSNFLVTPFVGAMKSRPAMVPDATEVAEILEVPLSYFLDQSNIREKEIHVSSINRKIITPYFDVLGHTVWGATAMILSEFRDLVMRENQS